MSCRRHVLVQATREALWVCSVIGLVGLSFEVCGVTRVSFVCLCSGRWVVHSCFRSLDGDALPDPALCGQRTPNNSHRLPKPYSLLAYENSRIVEPPTRSVPHAAQHVAACSLSSVHTGHSHVPGGLSSSPTQPKWNHSMAQFGLSQPIMSPNETRPHEQNVSSGSMSIVETPKPDDELATSDDAPALPPPRRLLPRPPTA